MSHPLDNLGRSFLRLAIALHPDRAIAVDAVELTLTKVRLSVIAPPRGGKALSVELAALGMRSALGLRSAVPRELARTIGATWRARLAVRLTDELAADELAAPEGPR